MGDGGGDGGGCNGTDDGFKKTKYEMKSTRQDDTTQEKTRRYAQQ